MPLFAISIIRHPNSLPPILSLPASFWSNSVSETEGRSQNFAGKVLKIRLKPALPFGRHAFQNRCNNGNTGCSRYSKQIDTSKFHSENIDIFQVAKVERKRHIRTTKNAAEIKRLISGAGTNRQEIINLIMQRQSLLLLSLPKQILY